MTYDKHSPTQEKAIACLKAHPNEWLSCKQIWQKAFAETWKNESGLLTSLHELSRKYENLKSKREYKFIAERNRRVWVFCWQQEKVASNK